MAEAMSQQAEGQTGPASVEVRIRARERDLNARGNGSEDFALVGVPGTGRLVYADRVDGAEIVEDSYPRGQGRYLAAERHGKTVVRLTLPVGSVIVHVTNSVRGGVKERGATRTAKVVQPDGTFAPATATARRRGESWVTIVDGVEWA